MDVLAIRAYEELVPENNVKPIAFSSTNCNKELSNFDRQFTVKGPRAVVHKL
jgi:hypothetical protein